MKPWLHVRRLRDLLLQQLVFRLLVSVLVIAVEIVVLIFAPSQRAAESWLSYPGVLPASTLFWAIVFTVLDTPMIVLTLTIRRLFTLARRDRWIVAVSLLSLSTSPAYLALLDGRPNDGRIPITAAVLVVTAAILAAKLMPACRRPVPEPFLFWD